ncbi:hypothetical protein M6B38_325345 [Iris pallida]|uniref:Uncharacterized protein n=1 Tax=Iris pallida TaxID=29817 RepID=A0AAX6H702_IRIPA|nr:hypothetical protein M6B38_325345 [Iris pallida]
MTEGSTQMPLHTRRSLSLAFVAACNDDKQPATMSALGPTSLSVHKAQMRQKGEG